LHGSRCENTNPGVEETAAPLRDRIADAIARAHEPTTATVHPLMEDYRDHADKVMEVIGDERNHVRADALFWAARQLRNVPITCTALTGPHWYEQGWKEAADHLMDLAGWEPSDGEAERTRLADRVRELEGKVERLTDEHLAEHDQDNRAMGSALAEIEQKDTRIRDLEDQLAGARQAALDEAANYLSGLSSYGTSWQFARKIRSIDVKAEQIQGPGYTVREMFERFEGDET
jgi:hypothetical protein